MSRRSFDGLSGPGRRTTPVPGDFEKLRDLLRELLLPDRAAPEFAVCRVMNGWREEAVRFLDEDLLQLVREAVAPADAAAGETAPENEVFFHLYTFFRLHRTNADRYYVKSAETVSSGNGFGRTMAEKQPPRNTARNATDYFIHKDLGGFLRRELDFYVKNEVLHLGDAMHEIATEVERCLGQLRIIHSVANRIISYLEQLENIRKKVWLKKKFVIGTNYCVNLDLVPEDLYPEVAENDAQREEWVRLQRIDVIRAGPGGPGYSEPLSAAFLKANRNLPLDTRHFPRSFVDRLLHSIDDLDSATSGLLVHADNFSALSLLQARYSRSAKCVYADPPYNTNGTPVVYKNGFNNSAWVSMVSDRLGLCRPLLHDDGILCATIDDCQHKELRYVMGNLFGEDNIAGTVVIRVNPSGRPIPSGFGVAHEYAIFAARSPAATIGKLPRTESQLSRYRESDERGRYMWELFRKRGSESKRQDRPTLYYPLYARGENIRVPKMHWDEAKREWIAGEKPAKDERVLYPVDAKGVQRRWRWKHDAVSADPSQFRVGTKRDGEVIVYYKFRPDERGVIPLTVWTDAKYSATEHGTGTLKKLFSEYNVFDFPKSVFAVEDCLSVSGVAGDALCIDPFAGSGTTGHAVISLNRRDGGRRRFVLIEMGAHFDTVLKPRILKVLYADKWDEGKPVNRRLAGSYLLKYFDLETYDDALSNLDLSCVPDVEGFRHPDKYELRVERGGDRKPVCVDLAETFNWLLGLRVRHVDVIRGVRVVRGLNPEGERVLVLWRDTDQVDGERLDAWFREQGYASRDLEYDLVYVNGDNNLSNLRPAGQTWQVRRIEPEFQRLMFDVRDE